jgi:hypothetical protein
MCTYFHDLGSVLYFREIDVGFVVLNPQWLVNVISELLTLKETFGEQVSFFFLLFEWI